MAAGDPILIGLTDASFLLASESGVLIQSEDRSVDSKLKEVFDASKGATVGYVFFDFVATQDFSAIINSMTTPAGLALAAPGVALTLANSLGLGTLKNGVSAGGLYTKTVKVSHQGEDLRMISGTAIQRQNVT